MSYVLMELRDPATTSPSFPSCTTLPSPEFVGCRVGLRGGYSLKEVDLVNTPSQFLGVLGTSSL